VRGHRLGRATLSQVTTIVTPDTFLLLSLLNIPYLLWPLRLWAKD
jgi:hypothetical protein